MKTGKQLLIFYQKSYLVRIRNKSEYNSVTFYRIGKKLITYFTIWKIKSKF